MEAAAKAGFQTFRTAPQIVFVLLPDNCEHLKNALSEVKITVRLVFAWVLHKTLLYGMQCGSKCLITSRDTATECKTCHLAILKTVA